SEFTAISERAVSGPLQRCYHFATISFSAAVHCSFESIIHLCGGFFLHARHHVRIEVHGDPDLALTKALTSVLLASEDSKIGLRMRACPYGQDRTHPSSC